MFVPVDLHDRDALCARHIEYLSGGHSSGGIVCFRWHCIGFCLCAADVDLVAALLLSGVVNVAAVLCLNRSLILAPASVVAPFQYTMIVWAIVLGFLVFGDVPSSNTMLGQGLSPAQGSTSSFASRRSRAASGAQPADGGLACRRLDAPA
jgi:hypothetical protein